MNYTIEMAIYFKTKLILLFFFSSLFIFSVNGKIYKNKSYEIFKLGHVTFLKGNLCEITGNWDLSFQVIFKYELLGDTVIIKSAYNKDTIENVKYKFIKNNTDSVIINITNNGEIPFFVC